MSKLPSICGAEVVRRLSRLGFVVDHQKGSHVVMRHPERNCMTVVPCHGSTDVKRGTLHAILKQAEVPLEDFLRA